MQRRKESERMALKGLLIAIFLLSVPVDSQAYSNCPSTCVTDCDQGGGSADCGSSHGWEYASVVFLTDLYIWKWQFIH